MLIPNFNPATVSDNMLGGSNAIFKSLIPIIELLIGAYVGFYILSYIIKIIRNHAESITEKKEKTELNDLAQELGFDIKEKDFERMEKENRFKVLKKKYSDEYDFEVDDDDDLDDE